MILCEIYCKTVYHENIVLYTINIHLLHGNTYVMWLSFAMYVQSVP